MSKKRTHNLQPIKFKNVTLPWLRCVKCGLVNLKNEASRKAIKQPCESDWDDDK